MASRHPPADAQPCKRCAGLQTLRNARRAQGRSQAHWRATLGAGHCAHPRPHRAPPRPGPLGPSRPLSGDSIGVGGPHLADELPAPVDAPRAGVAQEGGHQLATPALAPGRGLHLRCALGPAQQPGCFLLVWGAEGGGERRSPGAPGTGTRGTRIWRAGRPGHKVWQSQTDSPAPGHAHKAREVVKCCTRGAHRAHSTEQETEAGVLDWFSPKTSQGTGIRVGHSWGSSQSRPRDQKVTVDPLCP